MRHPEGADGPFSSLVRSDERLQPRESIAPLAEARSSLGANVEGAWNRFLLDQGDWSAFIDARNGRIEAAEGTGIPWIPGVGNRLRREDLGLAAKDEIDLAVLERIARKFVADHAPLFGIADKELRLSPGRSGKISDSLWLVDFDVVKGGLPIEGARIVFRVGHGNLIQLGSELLPSPDTAAPAVKVTREAAYDTLAKYVGGFDPQADTFVDRGSLNLLPVAIRDDRFAEGFEFARGYGLSAVRQIAFRREGVRGTWRGRVDATTGEIREFIDTDLDGQATGGVGADSALSFEILRQLPFTDLTGGTFTNSAGVFTYSGTPLTSTMNGQYVRANDFCGATSLTTDALGNLPFGTATGNNCATPGVGGAGNTRSSRTAFFHLNRGKEIVRGWLPGSSGWLNSQLTTNVNLTGYCDGFWNGSTIQLYQAVPGSCGASGEKPGFILHEFGHGVDANDGNGLNSSSSEAYADVVAALTLHNSCIGPGFRLGNCGNLGYGDPCTSCTGLRDLDWAKHSLGAAHTVANYTEPHCSPGSVNGPCGREVHCEANVPSEAVWDLANRDLPAPGGAAAWNVLERLWYLSRPSSTVAFACLPVSPFTSSGCNLGSWWNTMRAVDDDDGNLANGTPHSCNLYAAFNRHGIACTTDPGANTCFRGCTQPTVPALTLTPGNNSVGLSWTSSGAGRVYDVYRNDLGCNAGFAKIADDLSATLTSDGAVANGTTYYYQVTAHPSGNEACGSAPSTCVSVTPSAGPGGNILTNGTFETGSLSPWFKYPGVAPGVVAVESCCGNQTPGGTWDAYIEPNGQYVEMTQSRPISGTPAAGSVTPGRTYRLQVVASTKDGTTANLWYFTNVTSDVNCASTSVVWPSVATLQCTFTVPAGTTTFNVHLSKNSGRWVLSDNWSLIDVTP